MFGAFATSSNSGMPSSKGLNELVRDALIESCKEAVRPLVRLCIKHGISFQELTDALRYVFVESASEDHLPVDPNEATPARIAILSGISRREVDSIKGVEPQSKAVAARMNASVQVLSAWHADPDFTGPYGIPLELDTNSPDGFAGLAERYGNGLPTEEILQDLIQAGCVTRGKHGTVKVLRRSYISGNIDPVSIGYAGRCLRTLAETLEYNIENAASTEKRFQRQLISTFGIRASDLPAFNEIVKEAGQKFLEDLDSWTTEREKALKSLEKIPNEIPRVYPGVGLYMFFNEGQTKRKKSA